jgi:hypothetical protein
MAHENVPRKRVKFINFVRNIQSGTRPAVIDETWELFERALKPKQTASNGHGQAGTTNGGGTAAETNGQTETESTNGHQDEGQLVKGETEVGSTNGQAEKKKKKKKKQGQVDKLDEADPPENDLNSKENKDKENKDKENKDKKNKDKKNKKKKKDKQEFDQANAEPEPDSQGTEEERQGISMFQGLGKIEEQTHNGTEKHMNGHSKKRRREEVNEDDLQPSPKVAKFSWDSVLQELISSKGGSIKLKKLKKMAVAEYFNAHPNSHKSKEEVSVKVDKRLTKGTSYKVTKEMVQLQSA